MAVRYIAHFALLVTTFGAKDEAAACATWPGRGGQEAFDTNIFLQLVTETEAASEVAPVEEIAKAEIDLLKERDEQETEIMKKIVEMKENEAGRGAEVRGHAAREGGAGSGSAMEMEGRKVDEEEEAKGAFERSTRAIENVTRGRVPHGPQFKGPQAMTDRRLGSTPICVQMNMGDKGSACDGPGLQRITSVEDCNACASQWKCNGLMTGDGEQHEGADGWCYGDSRSHYGTEYAHHFPTGCSVRPTRYPTQMRFNPLCQIEGANSANCLDGLSHSTFAPICHQEIATVTTTKTVTSTATHADQSSVVGDPHVVNVARAKFEIRAGGLHKLVQIPQLMQANSKPDLRVDAEIQHLVSNDCSKSFMTSLSILGRWTEDAVGPMRISQGSDVPNTTLLINTLPPEAFFTQFPFPGVKVGNASVVFKLGDVSFHVGKHYEGRYGNQQAYLNVRITGLRKHKDLGGLLGYDDHADAEKLDANCMAAEPAAAYQSSFILNERPAPSITDGGSRIEAE